MMIRNSIKALQDEFAAYRRDLHENPQTSFEESYISDFVAGKLSDWGIPFERNIGKTGIVATITGEHSDSGKSVGLRADMDALDIIEAPNKDWRSNTEGKMHGCGHDGHTTILLATAKYLQENRSFNGTVQLIFQPAEETGEGAKAMMEDGLLERFPCDAMYALHNWPYRPLGQFDINPGASMAACDTFELIIEGRGGHAAGPHVAIDPIVIGAQVVNILQTIISRSIDPQEPAVLSITNFNSGTGAVNVIPSHVTLSGTVRSYSKDVQAIMSRRIEEIASSIAQSYGATAKLTYTPILEATINHREHARFCADTAIEVVGEDLVIADGDPVMAGEDFGAFLQHVPGAYVKIGQGVPDTPDHRCNAGLHHPAFDFNDDLIPIGTEFFVRLVEKTLKAA